MSFFKTPLGNSILNIFLFRDAKDAMDELHGRTYDKCCLKVEYPRGGGGRGGFRGGFGGGGRGRGPGRRSDYSVTVSGKFE